MTIQKIRELRAHDAWAAIAAFPRTAWSEEARDGDTQLGYWEWVEHQHEAATHDKRAAQLNRFKQGFPWSIDDTIFYLKACRLALNSAEAYSRIAESCDTSDEEMDRLRSQLQQYMNS